MSEFRKQSWSRKFRVAALGILHSFGQQNSFHVHLPAAALVIGLGIWLQLDTASWCVLVMCIGAVLAAELFNTSLEGIARAITDQPNEHIRSALDVASGAVLMTSLTTVFVGLLIFVPAISKLW